MSEQHDYTAASLAQAAGVARTYVARLCRAGVIPAVKVANAVWVIRHDDGAAWLAAREEKLKRRAGRVR